MIELFADISREKREQHEFFINLMLATHDLPEAAQLISDYASNCTTEEEREFIRFYIALKAEVANESNTDKR